MYERLKKNIKIFNQFYIDAMNAIAINAAQERKRLNISEDIHNREEFKLLNFCEELIVNQKYIELLIDEIRHPVISMEETAKYLNVKRINEHLLKISLEFQAIQDETNKIIFGEEIEND